MIKQELKRDLDNLLLKKFTNYKIKTSSTYPNIKPSKKKFKDLIEIQKEKDDMVEE